MATKQEVPQVSVTEAKSRKVLIAVDESANSKRAFEYYLDEIARPDDLLIILHIFNPTPPPGLSSKGKMSRMSMGMEDENDYINQIAKPDDTLLLLHIFNPPAPPALSSKGKMSKMGMGVEDHGHPFGHDLFLNDPQSKHWIAWRQDIENKMAKIKQYLSTYEDSCKQHKISCNVVLHTGDPGESICEMAEERDVTLIVIGSRGLNKIRRTFLGSVSDYVIHHCGVPVALIPPPKSK